MPRGKPSLSNMSWLEEHEGVLSQIPLSALTLTMHQTLCNALDSIKIRDTSEGICRDYRGIAQLLEVDEKITIHLEQIKNPTEYLLVLWRKTNPEGSFLNVLDILRKMTRYDVIDDLQSHIMNNLPALKRKWCPTHSRTINFVSRKTWGAQPPKTFTATIKLPLPIGIILFDQIPRRNIINLYEVAQQQQQRSLTQRGATDIDSNFLIGPDGTVLEGTGWEVVCGHSNRFANCSIIIAFIGNDTENPDYRMIAAAREVIEYGIDNGFIEPFYAVYGMGHIIEGTGPSDLIMAEIKKWSQYEALGALNDTSRAVHPHSK